MSRKEVNDSYAKIHDMRLAEAEKWCDITMLLYCRIREVLETANTKPIIAIKVEDFIVSPRPWGVVEH